MGKISFTNTNNPGIDMSAVINLPEGFDDSRSYPAIIVSHPGGGVKEQTAGTYAAELARQGITEIAVISPAFSADCIETLEEIQGEIREAFIHAGGREFTYIPCLNAEPDHIDVLTALVAENLAGWV